MPKSIPTNGQANWGTALNSHVGQLIDPTYGGFNIVQDEADRNAKYPNLTSNDDQLTVYNVDKGTFQVYDVSNVLGARWIDLLKDKGVSIVKVNGSIYTRYNVSDNTYDIIGTGIDFTKLSQSFSASSFFLYRKDGSTYVPMTSFLVSDIQNATTIRGRRLIKEPVIFDQTVTTVANSDIVTVQNSSVLALGDTLTSSLGIQVKEIINSTTIRSTQVATYSTTFNSSNPDKLYITKSYLQNEAIDIYVAVSPLTTKEQNGVLSAEFTPNGGLNTYYGTSISNRSGGSVSLTNNSIYNPATNKKSTINIYSKLAVKTGETNPNFDIGVDISAVRLTDPLKPADYQGTLNRLYGTLISAGHNTNNSGTSNYIYNTVIRTYLKSGSATNIFGLLMDDWTNMGGTMSGHYYPIYVSDKSFQFNQQVDGKASSYFGTPIAIGGSDGVFPKTNLSIRNLPTFADNAAATAAGLLAGDFYRKADGTVMVMF